MIDSISEQADAVNPELRRRRRGPAKAGTTNGDQLPPHSVEAEQGVIACILWDPVESMSKCGAVLNVDEWAYDRRHLYIYANILDLHHAFKPIDAITLGQRLRDKDPTLYANMGGDVYLSQLMDAVTSPANLDTYLEIVRQKTARRKILRTCAQVTARAQDPDGDVLSLLGDAVCDLEAISVTEEPQREKHIKTIVPRVIDEMQEYHRGKAQLHGLPTGLTYLDKVVQGIDKTHMFMLAARPGDGKTTLAMNIVEHVALDYEWWQPCTQEEADAANAAGLRTSKREEDGQLAIHRKGIPVAVFSLEMDDESLVKRMMFGRGGADMGRWNTGMATKDDFERLVKGGGELVKGQIWIDDVADQTIGKIRSRARRMAREHGIKLFVLDYIQLLDGDDEKLRNDRVRELTRISKAIVSLKKTLKIPWLVLAQMNRNIETAESKRVPVLSDLGDCGSFERDSDVVTFIYRPSMKDREENEEMIRAHFATRDDDGRPMRDAHGEFICDWSRTPSLMNGFVAKNRYGPTGKAEMLFFKNQTRFRDLREWKVTTGNVKAAAGESYKSSQVDGLPTNEEMGLG